MVNFHSFLTNYDNGKQLNGMVASIGLAVYNYPLKNHVLHKINDLCIFILILVFKIRQSGTETTFFITFTGV